MTDTAETTEEAAPQPEPPEKKPTWWQRHYVHRDRLRSGVPVVVSLTPSLLPRPAFQGLVSGAAGAIGYAIGVFAVWLVRYMRSKEASPHAPAWAWLAVVVVGVIGQILMIIYFHVWQDEVRDLNGVPRLTFWDHPLTAVLSIVCCSSSWRSASSSASWCSFLVRQLNRATTGFGGRGGVVAVGPLDRTAQRCRGPGGDGLHQQDAAVNDETDPDPRRHRGSVGGPGSSVSWESLGHQGRVFVSAGPTVDELSKFNGKPATEPIRAYAGLHSADGIKATAALAAQELRRTGG